MEQLNHIEKVVQYDDMPDMLEYKFWNRASSELVNNLIKFIPLLSIVLVVPNCVMVDLFDLS